MSYNPATAALACEQCVEVYLRPSFIVTNVLFHIDKLHDNNGNLYQELTFAGTCNPEDCKEDVEFYCVPRDGIGEVCKGDARQWDAASGTILKALDPSIPVATRGHSLGGSVAAIAALELHNRGFKVLDTYTFGAKRSGNGKWKAAWEASGLVCYRFVVRRDPVPDLECWLPHIGEEIAMGENGIPLINFHSIDKSYLPLVERL